MIAHLTHRMSTEAVEEWEHWFAGLTRTEQKNEKKLQAVVDAIERLGAQNRNGRIFRETVSAAAAEQWPQTNR